MNYIDQAHRPKCISKIFAIVDTKDVASRVSDDDYKAALGELEAHVASPIVERYCHKRQPYRLTVICKLK